LNASLALKMKTFLDFSQVSILEIGPFSYLWVAPVIEMGEVQIIVSISTMLQLL